jgi:glycosyltransferase involved in cell wall biosynthesis
MQDAPLVSIVIPAFNAGRWIEETLRSCDAQSYPRYEVIVVDDGSTDDTAALVERHAALPGTHTRLVRSHHAGLGATRNVGMREARGELFYYLDADDLVEPDALRTAVETMRASGAQAAVGDWYDFTSDARKPVYKHEQPFVYPSDPVASILRKPVVVSAILFPRSEVEWDEQLVSWEGQRYFMDVLPNVSRIARVPMAMARVRQRLDRERLTIKFDHFEPLHAMSFYSSVKETLRARGQLSDLREEAIDWQLLSYLYAARQRGLVELSAQVPMINCQRLKHYGWHKRTGLSGFASTLGLRAGLEAFYWTNRALGRARKPL